MGGLPSTPRGGGARPQETAEYLIGEFVGDKSFPLTSDYWQKLLELPLDLRWPSHRVRRACQLFAMNNCKTRHLAKILINLAWCLQECVSASDMASPAFSKALNALFVSSVFLKYLIENTRSDNFEELYLSLDESDPVPNNFLEGQHVGSFIMFSALNFIGKVNVSPGTYLLHQELSNFIVIASSTQLLSGPTPGPNDIHPFMDAAMTQESSLVNMVVRKLLLNYIARPQFSVNTSSSVLFSEGNQPGVLRRVSSAAASLVLLPFNYLVSSTGEASRSSLAEGSLHVLLILSYYRKCISVDYVKDENLNSSSVSLRKEETYFSENPFCKALENALDVEFDRTDIEGNADCGPVVRIPFASLFDTLGMCLTNETSVLLLYSLVHGNSNFLEYVLVRTDADTLLMPLLETLYNAPNRTSNHIYMVLVIFLILSQDSTFNASLHKLMLPNVPWYKERLLNQTSLGSLVLIILIRTVKYNLSKLRDVYLHTNCLATLANMAPHVHRLSAYASQRLVSLFDMLSRKYNKLAEITNDKMNTGDGALSGDSLAEDPSAELHIYTDFLRLVLEILNAILTYALPRNPEVVYAIMHRQEVFLPFKNHPRFNELLENIYNVLDFFNSRIDAQKLDGEWSVEKVLQLIVDYSRSWRGEGMKTFTQLRFTYEQESHPEEFFIPYVWQMVLSHSGFTFNASSINLFPVPVEDIHAQEVEKLELEINEPKELALQVEQPV
ncbi:dyggve-melchior-clausen syndrome protein [Perilla frutescens var. hirtella]|uniref:Dymeclin n=1 Tax=Perilla frutescens var. hirtella TaxID=608512 RepID=A0AAD4P0J0_PERFH|nr:dyggve-melchior-clausen syndrome protein [Perilla frutescens var. hirtella]